MIGEFKNSNSFKEHLVSEIKGFTQYFEYTRKIYTYVDTHLALAG